MASRGVLAHRVAITLEAIHARLLIEQALAKYGAPAIVNTDQASPYTLAFGKRCAETGVEPSIGTLGDAYDNAVAGSFFASLERDLINRPR